MNPTPTRVGNFDEQPWGISASGVSVDGTFADMWCAPPDNLVPIPDGVSFENAAPLGCAGITAVHAADRAGIAAGQIVAVHGIGGAGSIMIQVAAAHGARVIALTDADDKARLAEALGAETALRVADGDHDQLVEAIRDATRGEGVDHFVDFVGSGLSLSAGLAALRDFGTVVVAATQGEDVRFDPVLLLRKEARLVGTLAGSQRDLETR